MPVPFPDLAIAHVDDAEIVVDGHADEAAWAGAFVVPEPIAFQPVPDRAPTGTTVGRILADRKGIHLHVTATDPEPHRIRAYPGRRDTRFDDDWVGFWFDPTGEGQRQYFFIVNAAGAQMDGVNPSGAPEDTSWDGRWTSAVRRTDGGYEVELTIPWRSVRHPRHADHCGMFLVRQIARVGEKSSWPRLDTSIPGFIVQEAIVGGPGELPPSGALNLIPEVTFGWNEDGPSDGRWSAAGVSPGVTAEWSPGAVQTLATFNPDYSQVESDANQISVNQRYALYYEEKRPFFTEGREWFSFPFKNELVYTRSMVAPLYGIRATGEWDSWTIAALHVLDDEPQGTVTEGGDWTDEEMGDRGALATSLRIRRAMGGDASLGFIATDKRVPGTSLANDVLGVDGRARIGEHMTLTGGALGSNTRTTTEDAPDAAGYVSSSWASKHVELEGFAEYVGKDFRAENGFLTSADRMGGGGYLGFTIFPPWKTIPRIWFAPLDALVSWTTSGDVRLTALAPNVEIVADNGVALYVEGDHTTELYADTLLTYDAVQGEVGGSPTRGIDVGLGAQTGERPLYDPTDPAVGWGDTVWGWFDVRIVPAVRVALVPTWTQLHLDGVAVYDGFVARARLETFTSPTTWQRLIVDRSTFDGSLNAELLLALERTPGTAFYLGGSLGTLDPLTGQVLENEIATWQVFAKGSWVFSL